MGITVNNSMMINPKKPPINCAVLSDGCSGNKTIVTIGMIIMKPAIIARRMAIRDLKVYHLDFNGQKHIGTMIVTYI